MNYMKKIAVITGTRAEYGIIFPILKSIQKNKNLTLHLIVAGSHFSRDFGYTFDDIVKDGFKIAAKIDMTLADDTGARMARSMGVGIIEFTQALEMLKPDIVLVTGDREEMLAAAISALCLNIPVAHLHGGEVATGGHIDESIRYAITKFSHIHFVTSKKSVARILRLGEEPWRVKLVGAPFIDNLKIRKPSSLKNLAKLFNINGEKPAIIVLQHPLTVDYKNSKKHMGDTMAAVASFKLPTIVIYPNGDAGSKEIIEIINQYKDLPYIKVFKNLSTADFFGLLKIAKVLVGNSSSAIVEASSFHLPAVNIGPRQDGREISENIIQASSRSIDIKRAISKALNDKKFLRRVKKCLNPYDQGNASSKIVKILHRLNLNNRLLHKKISF